VLFTYINISEYPTINDNNNISYYIVYNDACDDRDTVDSKAGGGVVRIRGIRRVFVSIVIF
jgi:hypothetical protein